MFIIYAPYNCPCPFPGANMPQGIAAVLKAPTAQKCRCPAGPQRDGGLPDLCGLPLRPAYQSGALANPRVCLSTPKENRLPFSEKLGGGGDLQDGGVGISPLKDEKGYGMVWSKKAALTVLHGLMWTHGCGKLGYFGAIFCDTRGILFCNDQVVFLGWTTLLSRYVFTPVCERCSSKSQARKLVENKWLN